MAFMNQEKKKRLAPKIKQILKKHNIKGTLSVQDHSQLTLTLKSGSIDFGTDSINEYWYKDHFADNPAALAFLSEVIPAMNAENFDESDPMTDYFHVGYYISVRIGSYDKPYELIADQDNKSFKKNNNFVETENSPWGNKIYA
ncbi:MAG: hypothetical protein Unbinned3556contig1001_55 [Prokaryotic dsDNA virus sp.]|nr:MAG: hypothetical protein Unbinned3556contig1001_55 [Prokaryotic dsDNA virus sp.]